MSNLLPQDLLMQVRELSAEFGDLGCFRDFLEVLKEPYNTDGKSKPYHNYHLNHENAYIKHSVAHNK